MMGDTFVPAAVEVHKPLVCDGSSRTPVLNDQLQESRQILKQKAIDNLFSSDFTPPNALPLPILSEPTKYDQEKPRFSLVPTLALLEVIKVLQYGAKKYGDFNWMSGEGFVFSRVYDALIRHCLAFWSGETNDPETGLNHLAHAACNCLFLVEYCLTKHGQDDRRTTED